MIAREVQIEVEVVRRDADLLTDDDELAFDSGEIHDFNTSVV